MKPMKLSRSTLGLERIGKNRKREVINKARNQDWKEELEDYERSETNMGNPQSRRVSGVHGEGIKP
jgi:hypothetical protein